MESRLEFPPLAYTAVGQLITLAEAKLIDLGGHNEAGNAMSFARSYYKNMGDLSASCYNGIQGDLGGMRQEFLERHSKTRDLYHDLWENTGDPSKSHFIYACYGYSGDPARLMAWLGGKTMGKYLANFGF